MLSNLSQNCFSLYSRSLQLGLAVLLLGAVSVTTSGCHLFQPKTKPITPYEQSNIPADAVAIFFSKYQGSQSIVESVIRKFPEPKNTQPLQFALTELLKGPNPEEKSQGFYSEIPKGTKLLGVKTTPSAITVDLSSQFKSGGGSNSIVQRFEELKRTVKSVDTQHEVSITVDGKPLETLGGEGLEVPGSMQSEQQ
jgi:spore germination protein GerM